MPNLPISQLPQSSTLQGDELFVDVQGGVTKYTQLDVISNYVTSSINEYNQSNTGNTYLVPEFITINGTSSEPYPHFYLTGSVYENTAMIKVDWTGANGTAHIVLPDATTDTNRYRALRLTMGADFDSNTKGILFADVDNLGQTLDGSTGGYTLSKPYEGIMVWSDGSNWIRIQTKA